MPKDKNDLRPLSPHIQIYKPQITSITSIMHRITGVISFIGLLMFCWLIVYNVYFSSYSDTTPCDCISIEILNILRYIALVGLIFSLYYHLCNGIRHLFWDAGKGFDIQTANKTGKIVILIAVLLTVANTLIFII
jgi:succinate dehydrogenase / fumarate reductase cytochrome b subunit